ncbi:hypothetical protein EDD80_10263 [Anseongella ginsenosidimutans]|uniref:Uncharacterized protein n=1 Tax=Anseongella ginsenosidimutans TaxID=496056 RepID=A0A4V2UU33_9SPHI|nr:hypothetical protein [Anseongella ginsenosidimutans]QEC51550.1 hypothetical protein FRZ59_03755 [Anseongella ginsenosidimutans]TCS88873.1 hypothetical protein EDD80_10263 [Anseongella ginsenosidimutans]
MDKEGKYQPVLHIYFDKSILVNEDGVESRYEEGRTSEEAKKRLAIIKAALANGFLEKIILECQDPGIKIENLTKGQVDIIESLVNSVTSEVGRALVGLTILQLTVKSIHPDQSVRLHKGSTGADFSWKEGIPMRVLDKNHITPVLRKYNLLRLNADGFMMTRSLAENYPYSKLYKAAIRGARQEWLEITDAVETGKLDAENALKQLIVFLNNKSEVFLELTKETINTLNNFLQKEPAFDECYAAIVRFIESSTYSARMFEVAMHALFQVLDDEKCLSGFLKPLSQMRSANKKHGNIGDIELTLTQGNKDILESWDAKYGKTYLRDELEELNDKLKMHPETLVAGFVTDQKPNLKPEITKRTEELELIHETQIHLMDLREWVEYQIDKYQQNPAEIGPKWLTAIGESICQLRREIAPIDEPTAEWVESFKVCLKQDNI